MKRDSRTKIVQMYNKSRLVYERAGLCIPGVHSFGQHHYTTAGPGLPPHCHPGCVEISFLAKGYQAYRIDNRTYHVKGGEQYTSQPGEVHDTGSKPEEKGELYWLILDVSYQPEKFLFLAPASAKKLIADLRHLSARHFTADPDSRGTLDRAFAVLSRFRQADECTGIFKPASTGTSTGSERMAPLSADDGSNQPVEFTSLIVLYIMQTLQASKAQGRVISAPIRASMDFIALHESEWLDVATIAREIHISESQFKLRFREEVGLPPAEYMLRQKVDAAKLLLSQSDANITDVAHNLGFSSSQYFATVFRRYTTLTPSEFVHGHSPSFVRINENVGCKSMYA